MVAREIEVRRDLASLVPVNARIVPFPKNHTDARTTPILESRINVGPIHVHEDIPTEVRIPWRSDNPTTPLWTL